MLYYNIKVSGRSAPSSSLISESGFQSCGAISQLSISKFMGKKVTNPAKSKLKGELWEGNETAGLVHRSPALAKDERRLLLTLDFSI